MLYKSYHKTMALSTENDIKKQLFHGKLWDEHLTDGWGR
jgi:hypothetical protein